MRSKFNDLRVKTNRSQLIALLAAACVASGNTTVFAESNPKKPTVEFSIKPANSSQHEPPRMISLPIGLPPASQPLPLPNASIGTPSAKVDAVPAAESLPGIAERSGKVQMRISHEEPPKLSTMARQKNEVVRLNVAAELDSNATMAQTTPIINEKGPVKFSLGDSGVKDFGTQTAVQPPTIARSPELVKPKKVAVAQTVKLVANSDQVLEKESEESRQAGVKQSFSDMPTEKHSFHSIGGGVASETKATLVSSGIVTLAKPDRTKSSDHSTVGRGVNTTDIWRTAEVEKDYDIETQGTYSIDAPFEISHIETQDPERCSVFNNGRAITVVGKSEGSTKIAIFAKDKQYRVVRVKILPAGYQPSTPKSDLEQVKEMITNLFPDARLTFSDQESGGIEVRGTVKSESEARKVLELIRRICLVPVEDKVRVMP